MRTAARTAFFMIILTFISKCIGFVRELLLANFYGAGYIVDSYVMATSIPGIIFGGVFAAISTAYMPIFSKKMEIEGHKQGNRFTCEVINLALLVSIIAGIIGILLSNQIVAIFASGFKGDTFELTNYYVRITFLFVIFSSTISLIESFLQYKGIFIPQVIAGYIQNIIIIIVIIISYYTTHYALVFGWLIGYAVRMFMMLYIAKGNDYQYSLTLKINDTVKSIVLLAVPVFIGSGINQINMFIDRTLASGLPEGSVSALNYGSILIMMIQGLTITILVTISYPKLAQASAINDDERFGEILSTGVNLVAIIAIPCFLGGMLYSRQIVQIIYERGAFDETDTVLTSAAFFYYVLGLFFSSITSLMTQAFYSKHNMKTPMFFSAIGVIINIILNLILIQYMQLSGLALATSIAAISTAVLMFIGFKKYYLDIKILKSKSKLLLIILCAVISIVISWILYMLFYNLGMPAAFNLVLTISITGIIYLFGLTIFKIDEISLLKQIIRR